MPTFMEAFWSLASHDITDTLDKVVERVLGDQSVDATGRRRRAEALRDLGAAFVAQAEAVAAPARARGAAAGGVAGQDDDEAKRRRFEEAFVASMGGPGGRPDE
ncbi:unnamed protein product [Prorocentrum cordatum]|uniref:DNAJ-containing protein X-domain domain-containing protein n=1 Tax=Prorocentrum cordatum TaxID=2364126 RepID=A0ABN9U5E2_9DINO|nr:unnamed protein product [Polarella glacialis]